jgi:mono/diheme cytochrome c family protein
MPRTAFRIIAPTLALVAATTAFAGGWAVITVEDLPDTVVAGQPFDLKYSVRQHGVHLLGGLTGRIEAATAGRLTTTAVGKAAKDSGHYAATLTFPKAGDWTITIHSGFMNSRTTLKPLRVLEAKDRATAERPVAERGERLFVAKGCATCHVETDVGPKLAGKRYEPAWLARYLADPQSVPLPSGARSRMPKLNLDQEEIAALVEYVSGGQQAGAR